MTPRDRGPALGARLVVAVTALCAGASAQFQSFDEFTWTFSGAAGTSGSVTADLMHVQGPRDDSGCTSKEAVFTTTAPWAGTVRVMLDWQNFDGCHFDWPLYVVNGIVTKIPVAGDLNCFQDGQYALEFDVEADDVFGLGVGSMDCSFGPGVADWTLFSFLPPAWDDAGGALDPRLDVEIPSPTATEHFGAAVSAIGDVTGDGIVDVAVGAPFSSTRPPLSVHSGTDGALLWSVSAAGAFGRSLAAPGDVNGDGVPDLAAGAYGLSTVYMLSGANGSTIWSWTWSGPHLDYYGIALVPHADVNGDGVAEIAVGSAKTASLDVRIMSGADGSLLHLVPPSPGDQGFGRSLGAPGDIDRDGIADLMVAVPGPPARIRVYSGATLAEILLIVPASVSSTPLFGARMEGAGDVNADGWRDMAVGAPLDIAMVGADGIGTVTVYSGQDGAPLLSLAGSSPNAQFGSALAGGVDVDGDGVSELAIGAPNYEVPWGQVSGRVLIVRGSDGAVVQEIVGQPGDGFGHSVAWMSGPTPAELAVGAPDHKDGGLVQFYSDLNHSGGAPGLGVFGSGPPGTPWVVSVDHGLPGGVVLLVLGLSSLEASFKGGVLVPSPDLVATFQLDSSGALYLVGHWPSGVPAGLSLWTQVWMPDRSGPKGWAATPALRALAR